MNGTGGLARYIAGLALDGSGGGSGDGSGVVSSEHDPRRASDLGSPAVIRGCQRSFICRGPRNRLQIGAKFRVRVGFGACAEVRRVEIVLACDASEREQGVPSCVGERSPRAARRRRLADRTDRPFRRWRNRRLTRMIYCNKIN